MFASGFPCPEPIAGPFPFHDDVATAEAYVPAGGPLPRAEDAPRLSAAAFARLIELAPRPAEVDSLDPAPSWAAWDHRGRGLWPQPENSDVDLNAIDGPAWIDRAASKARDRMRAGAGQTVIGHCDWLADNVLWKDDALFVVHDWDSAVAESEDILVGYAAALYSPTRAGDLATIEETENFLESYGAARGRALTPDERERSWAAGVWTRAYDAKYQLVAGHQVVSLSGPEAEERLRRAGVD